MGVLPLMRTSTSVAKEGIPFGGRGTKGPLIGIPNADRCGPQIRMVFHEKDVPGSPDCIGGLSGVRI